MIDSTRSGSGKESETTARRRASATGRLRAVDLAIVRRHRARRSRGHDTLGPRGGSGGDRCQVRPTKAHLLNRPPTRKRRQLSVAHGALRALYGARTVANRSLACAFVRLAAPLGQLNGTAMQFTPATTLGFFLLRPTLRVKRSGRGLRRGRRKRTILAESCSLGPLMVGETSATGANGAERRSGRPARARPVRQEMVPPAGIEPATPGLGNVREA